MSPKPEPPTPDLGLSPQKDTKDPNYYLRKISMELHSSSQAPPPQPNRTSNFQPSKISTDKILDSSEFGHVDSKIEKSKADFSKKSEPGFIEAKSG